jgi:hypothetical protein
MPKHGMTAKWSNLAEKLEWDGTIQELQRYALIAMTAHPNPETRLSFLSFYFDEGKVSPSYYNHNVANKEFIRGITDWLEIFDITVQQALDKFDRFSLNDLKDMVRGYEQV